MKIILTLLLTAALTGCVTTTPKNDLEWPNLKKWEDAPRVYLPPNKTTIK